MCNAHSRVIKCQTMLNTFSEKYNCHSSNLYFPNILILFATLFLRSCWKKSVFYFTELNHCILKTIHWNRFLWIWHVVDDSSSFVNLSCSFKEDIQIKDTNVANMHNACMGCKTETRQQQIYFELKIWEWRPPWFWARSQSTWQFHEKS